LSKNFIKKKKKTFLSYKNIFKMKRCYLYINKIYIRTIYFYKVIYKRDILDYKKKVYNLKEIKIIIYRENNTIFRC